MRRLSLALSIFSVLLLSTAAHGQSPAPFNRIATVAHQRAVKDRAIAILSRLDQAVIVYRSFGEFEESHKLTRVSLLAFEQSLREADAEIRPLLDELPHGTSETMLINALDSYRDGAYWWRQIDQPRVVDIKALALNSQTRTSADAAFRFTIPYTVAVHWRQAHKYLMQAAKSLDR